MNHWIITRVAVFPLDFSFVRAGTKFVFSIVTFQFIGGCVMAIVSTGRLQQDLLSHNSESREIQD